MSTTTKKKPVEKVTLHIPMPRELAEKISSIAVRQDRTRNNMVITLCRRALEQSEQRA